MVEPYFFSGRILPERAQLSFQSDLTVHRKETDTTFRAEVSIILNQLVVRVHSELEWNIFDLRNIVQNAVRVDLTALGYLLGRGYEIEITRVVNHSKGVDYVYGIEVPCISEPRGKIDVDARLRKLRTLFLSEGGMFVSRCFNDLTSAIQHADDSPFYCYRAIEAIRRHCAVSHGLLDKDRSTQWQKFREVAGITKGEISFISEAAKDLRHGGLPNFSENFREDILTKTWAIVDKYLDAFE
ncbi:hypothetical protein [Ruegeria sp. YS9]|uniref:hypothetical protein n=1 Tax=Ruegeria sp. YS9 TaxID=2966453 RepID=UPI00214BE135|nr:hypothetical protein [Ruegeria sp. YS9]UUV07144.1 hypothetical protein NOR97_05150 [Ruegeria sp. YS9]